MAISINIQCLTFSFDLYSETKSSHVIGIQVDQQEVLAEQGVASSIARPLPAKLLPLGPSHVKGQQPSPCRPATLNQLQANISEEVAQINPAMMRRAMLDMKAKTVKCNPAVGGEQPVILPQRPPDPATELCSSFYARGRLPHESKDSSIRT